MSSWAKLASGPRKWLSEGKLPRSWHLVLGLVLPLVLLGANMWSVRVFTNDDAYISFRYARNLAEGLGLVYNPGERIEGYTNFLWTVLLAGGMKLGIDPHHTAKALGAAAACATLVVVYRLAPRLAPLRIVPCIATWLLASSIVSAGYAVFGLESALFCFLLLTGTLLMFREQDAGRGFPLSGLIFGLAGLTRPEAPLFVAALMLPLGRGAFSRRNIIRGLLFAAPILAHVAWRRAYYGAWLPTTFTAKTGDLGAQYDGGLRYVLHYIDHAGPVVFLSLFAVTLALVRRHRDAIAVTLAALAGTAYVIVVGGDWMLYFRFMAPIEPYAFLLVGMGIREIADRRDRAAVLALALFGLFVINQRTVHFREAHHKFVGPERRFWRNAAGATADWLVRYDKPGTIAIGDIGYVGYRTNYPILDLLGLVDPVISRLPGGYTRKLGSGFVERVFGVMPQYIVIIIAGQKCDNPQMPGSKLIYRDPRFFSNYELAHNVQVDPHVGWCTFERKW